MNDCVEWTRARTPAGYGVFRKQGVLVYAHRFVYEQVHGPIPKGMVVMHLCDNPGCVNIEHLRLGTQLDNIADMVAKNRQQRANAAKTHCKHGHEFTPENTWTNGKRRQCKTCLRTRKEEYRCLKSF